MGIKNFCICLLMKIIGRDDILSRINVNNPKNLSLKIERLAIGKHIPFLFE